MTLLLDASPVLVVGLCWIVAVLVAIRDLRLTDFPTMFPSPNHHKPNRKETT